MKLGSHVSMASPHYVLGSIQEMLSYQANACMIYTGPPQNGRRVPIEKLKIEEAIQLLADHQLTMDNVVVHAPYLINLANTCSLQTYMNSVELLQNEIARTDAIGSPYLVLHPGSHVHAGSEAGLASIIKGLNEAMSEHQNCTICLETMAGKGSECGVTFEQLRYILDGVHSNKVGVCLDTCHIHDAGYDLHDFDSVLDEFDRIIGLSYLKVIHLNDSKNPRSSHKDRHENLGHGAIGFDCLCSIAHHPRLSEIPIILETPYIEKKPPYKEEIKMLKEKRFFCIK